MFFDGYSVMLIGGSLTVWLIVIPLFAAQYALAIFCLTRLAYCKMSVAKYVVWNIFILLVFFVGSGVFLVYYFTNKQRLRGDETADTIKIDMPLTDNEIFRSGENANENAEQDGENAGESTQQSDGKNSGE